MSIDCILRTVTLADSGDLASLHAGCFADSWSPQSMIDVMQAPGTYGFIAEIPDAPPIGLALARVAVDDAELLTLCTEPGWRRGGIARRLVANTLREARARGAKRLFLEVAEDNRAARALYEAESFRIVGRRRGYYVKLGGPPTDALTMRRELLRGWAQWFAR